MGIIYNPEYTKEFFNKIHRNWCRTIVLLTQLRIIIVALYHQHCRQY